MDAPLTPPSATKLAAPFAPPPEFKPPPEPSLWPLLLLGLFGLTCLGGLVGVMILGISWAHHALNSPSKGEIASAVSAAQGGQPQRLPRQQPPQPVAAAPIPPGPALPPREFAPPIPDLPSAPEPPPSPEPPAVPPLPALERPEQELPPLAFGPADVEPLGREIHGDHLFQDIAPAGGWLVGLRATKGKPWNGAIVALQPIYQVGGEYHLGQQCGGGEQALEHAQLLAKPGYAVGKIEARLGLIMNAVRIEFYRVDEESLTPADSYATDWFGAEGGSPQMFEGNGSPLVGLAGSYDPDGEIITIQVLQKKSERR